jgi:hypothetical protein
MLHDDDQKQDAEQHSDRGVAAGPGVHAASLDVVCNLKS